MTKQELEALTVELEGKLAYAEATIKELTDLITLKDNHIKEIEEKHKTEIEQIQEVVTVKENANNELKKLIANKKDTKAFEFKANTIVRGGESKEDKGE